MLVTEMAKTVTNIFKLSPTHFVSNIRRQNRCSLRYLHLPVGEKYQKSDPTVKSGFITFHLRVVHTRALRIWIENIFSDFNFFLSKISRSDRGSNLRSFDFESFSTRLLKPLSYRANQNYSKTNRFYTKQICVGFFHFALFVISCIVKGAYWLKSPKKIFWPWNFLGAISGLLNHVTQTFLKKKS